MAIERDNTHSEIQQQELRELRQSQERSKLNEANRQGASLEEKYTFDLPDARNDDENAAGKSKGSHLDEKGKLDFPEQDKQFEDYTRAELQQMQEENPYKLDNLNADFRERYEADMYGMSVEDYRDYKDHLSCINQPDADERQDSAESNFDFEADKSRIAERQDAFVEKYLDAGATDKDISEYDESRVYQSSFTDSIKDRVMGKESSYDPERAETHGLEKGCFDKVPREYRGAVYEKFENAPDEIKSFINENAENYSVKEIPRYKDSNYFDQEIFMEKGLSKGEYADTFSHEYGHFYDDMNCQYSRTYSFVNAVNTDLRQFDRSTAEGQMNFDNMMDDLFSSDAVYDQMISDNLSAYFKNDSEIMDRYYDEGKRYFGHENEYWNKSGKREAEIYANSFSICASGNEASNSFMKTHFSETWNSFYKSLKEGI